jgi:hypothetical protein
LSNLRTKDLTRALTVSKLWQKSILGSIALRRIVFLEPVLEKEYIDYIEVIDLDNRDKDTVVPVLYNKPGGERNILLELHPALTPYKHYFEDIGVYNLRVDCVPDDILRAVHPSTFLFQPPIDYVDVWDFSNSAQTYFWIIKCTGGMTFGKFLKGMVAIRTWRVKGDGNVWQGVTGDMGEARENQFSFLGRYAVDISAKVVKEARETLLKAQSLAKLIEPDRNQDA